MYLILTHNESEARNQQAGQELGVKGTSVYRWSVIVGDNKTALNVGGGDGLTEIELGNCVDSLPDDFVKNWN